ncbi:cell division protein ZapA [Candidatus Avelusimicrobium aviculae]|uniref:cell division protein ZapA n=1 Tax=Candidatus Avelusimicrobium aviculae TaxID=3416206 RepID=UPI003D0D272E
MAKDIIQVEIRKIPLDVEIQGLGGVEITNLAAEVDKKMAEIRENGEIDTLKQALLAALYFAAQAYVQGENEGGRRKEEETRVDGLIAKLKSSLQ